MPSEIKTKMLNETLKKIEGRPIFFANFQGIEVADIEKLRKDLRKVADHVILAKNTIARKAFEQLNSKDAVQFLEGSILLIAAKDDPQPVSKILIDFAKEKENFALKGAFLEGGAQSAAYVKALANLPSRSVLIAKVVGGIKSPITGFVLTLNAINRGLVVALNEIKKKKESAQ
jgi:large subunit ribosomal protein L10